MKFLVIGLGSMGKRRIRCLQALGYQDIIGFDPREDRRKEAETLYKVTSSPSADDIPVASVDAFIISTPPDRHEPFLRMAVQHNKPAFVEASVVLGGLEDLENEAARKKVLIAPSCTMLFHPAIKEIKGLIVGGKFGKVTNFSYHTGQYLPDWHPWENVKDFYVSQRPTGGCREIVPFELTWMADVFGFPTDVRCFFGRTMNIGADIDDTYALTLKFRDSLGVMLVDVVSRSAIRNLTINLEKGVIRWNWDSPEVQVYSAESKEWTTLKQKESSAHAGYNKNIIEEMYQDELRSFIAAVKGEGKFPNSLDEDIRILKLLQSLDGIKV